MNEMFWEALEEVYYSSKNLFLKDINTIEDICSNISIYRSLRRSSTSQAIRRKVAATDIDIIARWRGEHLANGQSPNEAMQVGYAQQNILNECFKGLLAICNI